MNSDKFAKMTVVVPLPSPRKRAARPQCSAGQARNVQLVPGKRVVQAWRSGAWPAGVYSTARFELEEAGQGTKLTFDQSGYPDNAQDMLAGGWSEMYWAPITRCWRADLER